MMKLQYNLKWRHVRLYKKYVDVWYKYKQAN